MTVSGGAARDHDVVGAGLGGAGDLRGELWFALERSSAHGLKGQRRHFLTIVHCLALCDDCDRFLIDSEDGGVGGILADSEGVGGIGGELGAVLALPADEFITLGGSSCERHLFAVIVGVAACDSSHSVGLCLCADGALGGSCARLEVGLQGVALPFSLEGGDEGVAGIARNDVAVLVRPAAEVVAGGRGSVGMSCHARTEENLFITSVVVVFKAHGADLYGW